MMKETHARAAIVFREVAGDWLPVRSFFPQHPLTPVSRVECLRLARSLKEKWKPQDEESLPEPSYVTLPEGFRLLDVGLVGDVLVIPIRCSPSPLICCFLDPPSVLKKRVNLEILASFAQHTSGALDAAQNYRRMSELVYIDEVTGLFNARYLPLVLEARHKVYEKESAPFVVLFIDLDQFKKVNDTFGHLVGSDVLVKAGHVIRRSVRYDDAVFRYGGDEFVVILANSDLTGGVGAAERIRRNLESHMFDSHGVRVAVTATIGVACFPQHVSDINSIVDSADRAMYEGKRTSRNVVLVYDQGLQQTGS
jgi:diguanylate cyclase (GGDEF)-like protein